MVQFLESSRVISKANIRVSAQYGGRDKRRVLPQYLIAVGHRQLPLALSDEYLGARMVGWPQGGIASNGRIESAASVLKIAFLQLRISLLQYLDGRPIPADSGLNDNWVGSVGCD
jgi:hypothetical protein